MYKENPGLIYQRRIPIKILILLKMSNFKTIKATIAMTVVTKITNTVIKLTQLLCTTT
jgi:hypothetical protein